MDSLLMGHCVLPDKLVVDRLAAGHIRLLGPNMKPGHVVEDQRRIDATCGAGSMDDRYFHREIAPCPSELSSS